MSNTETSSRHVIRWAIGSVEGPRSSLWRLWGNEKGDIYVSVRSLGGMTKASFHRDGRCQVGFTNDYAATAQRRFGVKSRHWEKWLLPADEVVRILQVLVPHTELRRFSGGELPDATWLPPPPEGSIAMVDIFVSKGGTDFSFPIGAILVGSIKTSIRIAWVTYRHVPIDIAMATLIDYERARLNSISAAVDKQPSMRAVLWERREDYDRHVLELACD